MYRETSWTQRLRRTIPAAGSLVAGFAGVVCAACGTVEPPPVKAGTSVQPELVAAWQEFQADAAAYDVTLPINSGTELTIRTVPNLPDSEGDKVLGRCRKQYYYRGVGQRAQGPKAATYTQLLVEVSAELPEELWTAVLYHELGHCLLGIREHIEWPIVSLMASKVPNICTQARGTDEVQWQACVADLFQRRASK